MGYISQKVPAPHRRAAEFLTSRGLRRMETLRPIPQSSGLLPADPSAGEQFAVITMTGHRDRTRMGHEGLKYYDVTGCAG